MSIENLYPLVDIDAIKGLDFYPDFPYHNPGHGFDVIRAAQEWAPKCGFDAHHTKLLVLAAGWHDAGFGHEEEIWKPHGSKEAYAVFLMKQEVENQYNVEDVAFVERAIMGTMMGPDAKCDTPEAKFLHLMDLSYLWSDQETFLAGASAVRREEFSSYDDQKFLDLQRKFIPSYREELVGFLRERKLSAEMIKEKIDQVDANLAAITETLSQKIADIKVGATTVRASAFLD